LESCAVDWAGVELDSGGKQRSLIKALKAFSLALICLSRSVSFSIRSLSLLTRKISFSIRSVSFLTRKISFSIRFVLSSLCLVRASISRTGRQLSIDKKERHRGSDAGDSPLLGELECAAGEGDVVIGGEKGNQGKNHPTERLGDPEAIQARPWTYE
jgi:hypothetical protein